jgi:Tol biopolymer transport system component
MRVAHGERRGIGVWTGIVIVLLVSGCSAGSEPLEPDPGNPLGGEELRINPATGNNQTGPTGAALATPLRARLTNRSGNPVPGAPVTFEVVSGDGTVEGNSAVTDAQGFATSGSWILGPVAGTQQVRAGASGAETIFTAFACDDACQAAQLAFVRDERIYTLVNGAAAPLTGGSKWGAPAWSPDGHRIAFVSYEEWHGSIYLMNADGSGARRFADGHDSPAWSPDGQLLAVDTGVCIYDCDIYLLSVAAPSSDRRHIASQGKEPAWSPDGTQIAFVSLSGDDGYHALYIMNADGSDVRTVTARDEGAIFHPTWSPDGRRIAFAKCLAGVCDIYAVNPDGSDLERLTAMDPARLFDPAAFDPAWSPDGARIAFTLQSSSGGGLGSSVAYIPADGGSPVTIVSPGHSPAWRP